MFTCEQQGLYAFKNKFWKQYNTDHRVESKGKEAAQNGRHHLIVILLV